MQDLSTEISLMVWTIRYPIKCASALGYQDTRTSFLKGHNGTIERSKKENDKRWQSSARIEKKSFLKSSNKVALLTFRSLGSYRSFRRDHPKMMTYHSSNRCLKINFRWCESDRKYHFWITRSLFIDSRNISLNNNRAILTHKDNLITRWIERSRKKEIEAASLCIKLQFYFICLQIVLHYISMFSLVMIIPT